MCKIKHLPLHLMPNKILFISIDGMTDPLGQSQVLPYLIGLSEKGYKINIASCEKEINLKRHKDIINSIVSKHSITWSYCFYQTKIPFVSQIQNYLNLKRTVDRIVKDNTTILHCRSYLPALIGLQLKRKHANKFIFDMRGFWADERIDGNIWHLRNPLHKILYNYFKRKEIELIEKADYVVTLTNNAKREIELWKLKPMPKIKVIPCCVDLNHFVLKNNEDKINNRNKLDIVQNSYVVGYLGSLGTWYMLDEMFDFFKELHEKKTNSIFFFITNDKEQDIRNVAESKGILPECIIVKSAKREDVPNYISCLDIGLFFIKPLYSKKGSSPTKLAELLAGGIPIITNTGVGDVDELILRTNCGILVSSFNKEEYKDAMDKIQTLNTGKQYYRNIALTNFSLKKGIESYSMIYDYLTADK